MTVVRPQRACGTGVLVLAASSGAVDLERAELLAAHGAVALALRWFGGPGQQPGPWHVPVETFTTALDILALEVDRLTIVGASFGAEAALCLAATDTRINAVVAISPSPYVWPAADQTGQLRSHWTRHGTPLPFVPFDHTWTATSDPPAFRTLHERSLHTHPTRPPQPPLRSRTSPANWSSSPATTTRSGPPPTGPTITNRRAQHQQPTTLITHPEAGHRVILPGEQPVRCGQHMQRGGNDTADAELGTMAWPHVRTALHLNDAAIG